MNKESLLTSLAVVGFGAGVCAFLGCIIYKITYKIENHKEKIRKAESEKLLAEAGDIFRMATNTVLRFLPLEENTHS